MDKDKYPRWAWLLLGLIVMSLVANVLNVAVFSRAGLPEDYYVVTVIAAMAPVLIFLGVWFEDDRAHYWEQSQMRIVGDLLFVMFGAAVGAAGVLVFLVDTGFHNIIRDIVAMAAGFILGWALFWWRNPDVYATEEGN